PGSARTACNNDVAGKDIDVVSRTAHIRDDGDINGSRYRASILCRKNPNGEPAAGFRAFAHGVHHAAVSSSSQNNPTFVGNGRTQSECVANIDASRIFARAHNPDYSSTSHAFHIRTSSG